MININDQTFQEIIARANNEQEWQRWQQAIKGAGYCARPVKLRALRDSSNQFQGVANDVLLKACGTRKEAVCKPCSFVYRGDAWQLIAAGLHGGKGVPETVASHPLLFVTFTAPSFGTVHRLTPNDQIQKCLPRRNPLRCQHGIKLACWQIHRNDDELVGQPICLDCFDYENALIWNALAPELWRRTTMTVKRELARGLGITNSELKLLLRLSFFKVSEYQARGLVHFHAIVRLDGIDHNNDILPPEIRAPLDQLTNAIDTATNHVTVPAPSSEFSIVHWGEQTDLQVVDIQAGLTPHHTASYIAKYTTKYTEIVGNIDRKITPDSVDALEVNAHIKRYLKTAFELSRRKELTKLKLERNIHQLGFRGHWSSKSRCYSTTFAALRKARQEHVAQDKTEIKASWKFAGTGHETLGDELICKTAAQNRAVERCIARVELRSGDSL